jgi:hypothetical protein
LKNAILCLNDPETRFHVFGADHFTRHASPDP